MHNFRILNWCFRTLELSTRFQNFELQASSQFHYLYGTNHDIVDPGIWFLWTPTAATPSTWPRHALPYLRARNSSLWNGLKNRKKGEPKYHEQRKPYGRRKRYNSRKCLISQRSAASSAMRRGLSTPTSTRTAAVLALPLFLVLRLPCTAGCAPWTIMKCPPTPACANEIGAAPRASKQASTERSAATFEVLKGLR